MNSLVHAEQGAKAQEMVRKSEGIDSSADDSVSESTSDPSEGSLVLCSRTLCQVRW